MTKMILTTAPKGPYAYRVTSYNKRTNQGFAQFETLDNAQSYIAFMVNHYPGVNVENKL